jgi:hypothetical protein
VKQAALTIFNCPLQRLPYESMGYDCPLRKKRLFLFEGAIPFEEDNHDAEIVLFGKNQ